MRGSLAFKETYQRTLLAIVVTLAALGVLLAVLLPFRAHLSIAIPALAFVLPALVGVVIAGFVPGLVGALGGFLAYDYFFLPPYETLTVRSPQNWIALLVYLVVVLVVAQVVANLRTARQEALRRTEEAHRLYDLSRTLIGDLTLNQLVNHVVGTVQDAFSPRWTALVLPDSQAGPLDVGERLHVAASAGEDLTGAELASLVSGGQTRSLGFVDAETPTRVSVALVLDDRPVGILVLQDAQLAGERSLLGTFANQAALAVDRARLRDQALRTRLLEEIDRWRSALMGAVSHDLRTPLASVKTAVSSLRSTDVQLPPQDRAELLELIEKQADQLSRLVTNLLDMTRIEAGALEVRPIAISFDELVAEALMMLGDIADRGRIRIDMPDDLALLHIDHVLISQVVANLIDNAERLSPPDGIIRIAARPAPGSPSTRVEISVSDQGPGVGPDDRERVFEMFSQNGGGGRAGLGLAIAKAFVEAHGGLIWIDPDVERGARVVFTVPSEARVPTSV